jgi:hypothetical protein
MMKKLLMILTSIAFALLFSVGIAGAASFGDGGANLQGFLDGITKSPSSGTSSVDVTSDEVPDALDSYWDINCPGGSTTTITKEDGWYQDHTEFGIFEDTNPSITYTVFYGSDTENDQALLTLGAGDQVYVDGNPTGIYGWFGYFYDTYDNVTGQKGGFWYSDTSLNTQDSGDHMYAYRGQNDTIEVNSTDVVWTPNKYMLAWEDMDLNEAATADIDYADMVLFVDCVNPVPISSALVLFGSGLLGLIGVRRLRS